ncbi:MAG: hypothetical protein R3B39_02265 [Candidatus Paceibacterota bacterium]
MFYNKDHFDSAAAVTLPPKLWKDFSTLIPTLTEKNELLEIKKEVVLLWVKQKI